MSVENERPLMTVVEAIQRGESTIPLAWVVRWSAGDVDPLAAAWNYCEDRRYNRWGRVMILDYMGFVLPRGIAKWATSWQTAFQHGLLVGAGGVTKKADPKRVDQLWRALARIDRKPPTLPALLAAMQAKR